MHVIGWNVNDTGGERWRAAGKDRANVSASGEEGSGGSGRYSRGCTHQDQRNKPHASPGPSERTVRSQLSKTLSAGCYVAWPPLTCQTGQLTGGQPDVRGRLS